MFTLANNVWLIKSIRIFFYWLDNIIFNFIPTIYDMLIQIARTSVLSQGDIAEMADRVYKLLAIFMIFKVTFSLIMYVVNPDDFSEKTKGIGKLTTNILISLSLLILTPYIFRMAYEVQTIILEDNSLAELVFGKQTEDNFLSTAGEKMSYIAITPFFTPNVSLPELYECSSLIVPNQTGDISLNDSCLGIDTEDYENLNDDSSMYALLDTNFTETTLKDYTAGVKYRNLGLMFRQNMVTATTTKASTVTKGDEEFIMEYKFFISTVVGVLIVLLLVTFCMDVAVRSIKLAFYQLIAPIPIISYVDPKSGKDGMFKKWYQACFKTFLSLFVRLLALYFAIYIISKVADWKLIDIIDGHYITNAVIYVFIIIGALMFAKQFPKILEGLGVKLDGGFTLSPLKKLESEAALGKNISGAISGAYTGMRGNKGLRKITGALGGLGRGALEGKGWKEQQKSQADVNRKLRDARANHAGFFGTRRELAGMRYGSETPSEVFERRSKDLEAENKFHQANFEYAKGIRDHILDDLEHKSLDKLKGNGSEWEAQYEKLRDARAKLISAQQSGNQAAIQTAEDELREAQDTAVREILAKGQEDSYLTAEREKYNVRVENHREFARSAGITRQDNPINETTMDLIKGSSKRRANVTESRLYEYRESDEASRHRGEKEAAEARNVQPHVDGFGGK